MSDDWIDNAYFMQKKALSPRKQMSFGKGMDMTQNSFATVHQTMGQSTNSVFGKQTSNLKVDPKLFSSRQNTFKGGDEIAQANRTLNN